MFRAQKGHEALGCPSDDSGWTPNMGLRIGGILDLREGGPHVTHHHLSQMDLAQSHVINNMVANPDFVLVCARH